MAPHLEEVLARLGWEDGFQIPVANAENQALEAQLAQLTLRKVKVKAAAENAVARVENLEGHLKHIKQEQEENQKLLAAYAQQLQAEDNRFLLSQAEKSKLEQDIRNFIKTIADVEERQKVKRTNLEKSVAKLEKLKTEASWDAEALKAWEESLQKRDEDNELIQKFSKEDERRYNDLEAKRQNLEVEYAVRTKTIEKMANDLINYERILERTGKMMKQQLEERDNLICQWKISVKNLHQRDQEIERLQNQVIEMQELQEKQEENLEEQNEFYQNEKRNNHELTLEMEQLNNLNSRFRMELNDIQQEILLIQNESAALRRTVTSTANQLEKERKDRDFIEMNISNKELEIEKYQLSLAKLQQKLDEIKQSSMNSAERGKELERMIKFEEKQQNILMQNSNTMQLKCFKALQEQQDEINAGKVKESMLNGYTNSTSNIRKNNKEIVKTLSRQKEVVYELNFQMNEVEQKIMDTELITQTANTEQLEAKVSELEMKMAEHMEVRNLLKDQVSKLEDDLRRLTTAIENEQQQVNTLKDKLQDQILNFEGGKRQLDHLKGQCQERQVEESVLLLKLNQLEKGLKKEDKTICGLQKFRVNLEQAMMERLLEINAKNEVLQVKRRNLSEDKGRLRADLAEREIRLEQFRTKYNLVISSFGKDEDGQPFSVTHFKIKNAQEKYLLQQEGDELDSKIKKAEKEIVAMENTLKVINVTNAAFKNSLAAVEEDGLETDEMKGLEGEMYRVNDRLRGYRKEVAKKKQELNDVKNALESLNSQTKEEQENLSSKEAQYLEVQQQVLNKEDQIKRTGKCFKRLEKKLTKSQVEKYDRDLEIRQIHESNKIVLHKLLEMTICYPEMGPLITRYSLEYNVKLPEQTFLSSSSESNTQRSYKSQSSGKSLSVKSTKTISISSRTAVSISKVSLSLNL